MAIAAVLHLTVYFLAYNREVIANTAPMISKVWRALNIHEDISGQWHTVAAIAGCNKKFITNAQFHLWRGGDLTEGETLGVMRKNVLKYSSEYVVMRRFSVSV